MINCIKITKMGVIPLDVSKNKFAVCSIMNLLVCVLLGLFCSLHSSFDPYMEIVLIVFLIGEAVAFYTYRYECDIRICVSIVWLYSVGMTLQALIGYEKKLLLFSIVSVVMAALAVIVYTFFSKVDFKNDKTTYISFGVISGVFLLFVLVLALSDSTNGAHAWINLFGFSLQITEFFKPLFFIFHAVLFSSEVKYKWIWSAVCTLVMSLSLVLLNELGTLFVIILLWLCLSFLFFEKKRITAYFAGGITLLGGLGWLIIKLASDSVNKQAELGESTSGIILKLARIYNKLNDRISIWLSLDKADPYGIARQAIKAREAMIKGGFWGTTETVNIPVEASDYAFIALLLRCGIIFAIFVLLMFGLLYAQGISCALNKEKTFDKVALTGCSFSMLFPLIVNVVGTTNAMPMTGVAIPFISAGGTSLLLSFSLAFILLWSSGRNPNLKGFLQKINTLSNGGDPSRNKIKAFKRGEKNKR